MSKLHSFDIEEAKIHGVSKAILLHNMRYWLDKNRANHTNDFDGCYWTYNTSEAFAELFPYFNSKSISRWLNELEADKIIASSKNYNKMKFDRTKWYTILKEYCSISQNEKRESQSEETIPNSKPNSKPNKKDIEKEMDLPKFIDRELWNDFIDLRKSLKAKNTDRALKMLVNNLEGFEKEVPGSANKAMTNSIMNSWKGVFAPKKGPFNYKDLPSRTIQGNLLYLDYANCIIYDSAGNRSYDYDLSPGGGISA